MGNCSIFIYILDNSRRNASTVLALNKKDDSQKVNSLDFGWELVQNLPHHLLKIGHSMVCHQWFNKRCALF